MKRIFYIPVAALACVALWSCDKFLDTTPDNRATLDSPEKIQKLLVAAYANRSYVRMAELASDNCDDMGPTNPNGNLLMLHNSYWQDMTEADNDSNQNTWAQYYSAIGVANTALEAIEAMGTTDELKPFKGEALMCRAYAHFCLTMLYCLPYHPEKSDQYPGIPYMESPEKELNPHYVRGDLKSVYEKIDRDIEEALPLMDNSIYSVPKYHFNVSAAYAFAARFNLYYMKWDKVVRYADVVLRSNPATMLRDWTAAGALAWDNNLRTNDYIDPKHKFSLMLVPLVSATGGMFNSGWSSGARFAHNTRVNKTETFRAKRPMGGPVDFSTGNTSSQVYRCAPYEVLANNHNKAYMFKWTLQWETVNQVTGAGYGHATHVAFTTNEVLLNRAEAYIHLKEYDKAAADLEVWNQSFCKVGNTYQYQTVVSLTRARINDVYGNPASGFYIAQYTSAAPTSRKPLHPHGFEVEAGEQESFIQCLLYCRRLDTHAEGLRWGDVKRYGIVVDRFDDTDYIDSSTSGFRVAATLDERDLRRALQLPQDVVAAGLQANPRNEDAPGHPFRQ
ncbi:hypothetical protein FACS1894159_09520 [Bacteroidia bacterium]|nr:hypothetical protein FACS1894159_09520 [Bacteroidia bacterium]